jgi:hypothetical protein
MVAASYQVGSLGRLGAARTTVLGAAAMLPDGDVLLFGGNTSYTDDGGSDRIFRMRDVNGGDWSFETVSTRLPESLVGLSATTVEVDGKPMVFVAGGAERQGQVYVQGQLSTWAGLYDPEADAFIWEKNRALPQGFAGHRAVRLSGGNVLIVGRHPELVSEEAMFVLFDPQTQKVLASEVLEGIGAQGVMAAALGVEGALVCGGALITDRDVEQPLQTQSSCVRIDNQGTWRSAEPLPTATAFGTMVGLTDGSVLLTGGVSQPLGAFELLPASDQALRFTNGSWKDLGAIRLPRSHHAAIPMHDGAILVGGTAESGLWLASNAGPVQCAERFDPVTESFKQVGCNGAGSGADPTYAWWPGRGAFVLEGWSYDGTVDEGGVLYGWVGMGPE